jgi:hypothetical protein
MNASRRDDFPRGSRIAACVALAALVFATRAWLIRGWGSPIPFWDEWGDAELYRAWLTDAMRWPELWAAHNEHRIFLTRFSNLVLFALSGEWNPWSQLLLNAVLHALAAAAVVGNFWPELESKTRPLFLLGAGLLFTATAGWQNALWGFQSQVYFSNLLAVVAFVSLSRGAAWESRWWVGVTALLLALFSNGGGLLAAVAALVLAWPRSHALRPIAGWLVIAGIVAIGLMLRGANAQHAPMQAKTFTQFFAVFGRSLGWPHVESGWFWLALHFPMAALAWQRWHRRQPWTAAERCASALVLFALLHAAAIAFMRGAGLPDSRPLSRYQDPLILGIAGQLFAVLRFATLQGRSGRILGLGWSALVAGGLLQLTTTNLSLHLPFKRAEDAAALSHIHAYLETGDVSVLRPVRPFVAPHPNPEAVRRVLDDPLLQPVLPAVFREPDARPPRMIVFAPWLTAAALAGFLFVLGIEIRRRPLARTHGALPSESSAP